MIRALDALTLAALALLALIFFQQQTDRDDDAEFAVTAVVDPPAQRDHAVATAFEHFPVGTAVELQFDSEQELLSELTRREQADQARDWMLTALVGDAALSAAESADVLYDLPPTRSGYMRPVGAFEYGNTRSCVLPGGQVIALIPEADPSAQRDALSYIADARRKDTTEKPPAFYPFIYSLDVERGIARVTRQPDVDGQLLFSEAYGYVEQEVSSVAGLKRFLSHTDDITFVSTRKGLVLGGRKQAGSPLRNVEIGHVAAIWTADHKIQQRMRQFEQEWDQFNNTWSSRTYRTSLELNRLTRERDAEAEKLEASQKERMEQEKIAPSVGFSLDPDYNWPFLANVLSEEGLLPFFKGAKLDSELAKAIADAHNENLEGFLELRRRLESRTDTAAMVAGELLKELDQASRYQHARYDGDIGGTVVGMNLFYTDLLAKLWALDFMEQAPAGRIPDFRPITQVRVSPVFEAEDRRLSSTRLWFGHQDDGFQKADGRIFFGRTATRVYAASSDPLYPGKEAEPSATSEAFLGWWNDHYDEIARYEPEYQRLNAIMKWSLISAWLHEEHADERLSFLDAERVDASHWFPEWAEKNRQLKFNRWDKVNFSPRGERTVEALPILSSQPYQAFGHEFVLSGGVSLASKQLFTERSIPKADFGKVLRRSRLDYKASSVNELRTITGTRHEFTTRGLARTDVSTIPRAGAKARGFAGEVANQPFTRAYTRDAKGLRISGSVGDTPLGTLRVANVGKNQMRIGWEANDASVARGLARRMSAAADPLQAFSDPRVETVAQLDGEAHFAVRLKGAREWIELAPDEPSVALDKDWHARIADPRSAKRSIRMRTIGEEQLFGGLDKAQVSFEPPAAGRPLMVRVGAAAPNGRAVSVTFAGDTLQGNVDARGAFSVNLSQLRAGRNLDISALRQRFGTAEFAALRSGEGASPIALKGKPAFRDNGLTELIRSEDYARAAKQIADDPSRARAQLQARARQDRELVDGLLENGKMSEAKQLLSQLVEDNPHDPQLQLRRALVDLKAEHYRPAADVTGIDADPRALRSSAKLFDEVSSRLKSSHGAEQRQLRLTAQFLEFQDLQARSATADAFIRPEFDKHGISLRETITKPIRAEVADLSSALADPRTPIYVEDTAGLNAYDWSASREQTLHQVAVGDLYAVVKIARADVAHFRPAKLDVSVALSDASAQSHTPSVPKQFRQVNSHRSSSNDNGSDQDDDDDDDDDEDADAYHRFDSNTASNNNAANYVYLVVEKS